MKQVKLILAFSLLLLVVIFVLQNAEEVHISLWLWEVKSSMALVLFSTLALGVLVGLLFSVGGKRKSVDKEKKIIEEEI